MWTDFAGSPAVPAGVTEAPRNLQRSVERPIAQLAVVTATTSSMLSSSASRQQLYAQISIWNGWMGGSDENYR
jgi:hypothetical protein